MNIHVTNKALWAHGLRASKAFGLEHEPMAIELKAYKYTYKYT